MFVLLPGRVIHGYFCRLLVALGVILAALMAGARPVQAGPAAQLAVVDITSSITVDTTWSNSYIYYVRNDISVAVGVTLTIEPGTIVKFYAPSPLPTNLATLTVLGNLSVQPAPAVPVVFTSGRDDEIGGDTNGDSIQTRPGPGDWDAVALQNSSAELTNITVRYGFRGLQVINTTTSAVDPYLHGNLMIGNYCGMTLSVDNSGGVYGLVSDNIFQANEFGFCTSQIAVNDNGLITPTLENNQFIGNRQLPLYLGGSAYPVYLNNTFQGYGATPGAHLGIGLGGVIYASGTWGHVKDINNLDMPFVVVSPLTINTNVTVTIPPATVVKFYTRDEWINPTAPEVDLPALTVNGNLTLPDPADPAHPVIFTSYHDDVGYDADDLLVEGLIDTNGDEDTLQPAAGDWYRVYYADNRLESDPQYRFEHLQFRYAVNGFHYEVKRGIGRSPVFSHLTFKGNVNGLRVRAYSSGLFLTTPIIEYNQFMKNGRIPVNSSEVEHGVPIYLDNAVYPTYTGNVFVENLYPALGVGGIWRVNTTWETVPGQDGKLLSYLMHDVVKIGNEADASGKDDTVTLTIPAGTVVQFNVNDFNASYKTKILAAGALDLLSGPSTDPVVFTSIHDPQYRIAEGDTKSPTTADWLDVEVRHPNSRFGNVTVRYGQKGLHLYNKGTYEHNSPVSQAIFENNTYGLYLEVEKSGDITSVVSDCVFQYNSYGLGTYSRPNTSTGVSRPILQRNTFEYHSEFPIYLNGTASPIYATDPATGNSTNHFPTNPHRAIALGGFFNSNDDVLNLPRVPRDRGVFINEDTFDVSVFILPYVVWEDTTFYWGTRTHMDGGLVVKVRDGKSMKFFGSLDMDTSATPGDQNYFTSYNDDYYDDTDAVPPTTLYRTDWQGIYIQSPGTLNFSYSTILYARYGLVLFQASDNPTPGDLSLDVFHNLFSECERGLSMWIESNNHIYARVHDNTFTKNNFGLYTYSNKSKPHLGGSYPDLARNHFSFHSEFPIYLNGTADPNYHVDSPADRNVFEDNTHPAIALGGYWTQDVTWTRVPYAQVNAKDVFFPYVVYADVYLEVTAITPYLEYADVTIPGKSLIKLKDDGRIYAYGKLNLPTIGAQVVGPDTEVIFTSYRDDATYFNDEIGGDTNADGIRTPTRTQWESIWLMDFPGKYHEIHHTISKFAESAFTIYYANDDENTNVITRIEHARMEQCNSAVSMVVGWRVVSGVVYGGRGNIFATLNDLLISDSNYGLTTAAHTLSTGISRPALTDVTFSNITRYPIFFGGTTQPDFVFGNVIEADSSAAGAAWMGENDLVVPVEMAPQGFDLPVHSALHSLAGSDDSQAAQAISLAEPPGNALQAISLPELSPAIALGGPWNNTVELPALSGLPYAVAGGFPVTYTVDGITFTPGANLVVGEARPNISVFSTLAVPPGAVFKFASGLKMEIKSLGDVSFQSTATSPILFTSIKDDSAGGDTNRDGALTRPAPGDWLGVVFSSKDVDAEFHDTIVRYAAEGLHLYHDGDAFTSIDLWVHDNTFMNNTTGLTLTAQRSGDVQAKIWANRFTTNTTHLLGRPSSVSGSLGGRLLVEAIDNDFLGDSSQKAIVNNNQNNLLVGSVPCDVDPLTVDRNCVFNAMNNFWGHESGPTHNLNPGGQGSSISSEIGATHNNVLFLPFKTGGLLPPSVFTIRGRVTQPIVGDPPLAGVQIVLEPLNLVAVTDSEGYYTIEDVPAGQYSLVPYLASYVFSPPQMYVNLVSDASGLNFLALLNPSFGRFVSIESIAVVRPYNADQVINVRVSLDQPNDTGATLNVTYTTIDGSAVGGAPAVTGVDYTLASGTLSFANGQQVKTIPITIRRGSQTDPDEFFTIQLSLPSNSGSVSLSVPIGVITIVQPSRIFIPVVFR